MLARGAPFRCGPGPWSTRLPYLFIGFHEDFYPAGDEHQGIPRGRLGGRDPGADFSGKDGYSMYHGASHPSHNGGGTAVPGFPAHPHSNALTTITVTLKGMVDHFDSKGNVGRYGNGDVQWASFSTGAQHSEMFPLIHEKEPNPLFLLQIWQLIPPETRNKPPSYVMQWREQHGRVEIPIDGGGDGSSLDAAAKSVVTIISGEYMGQKPAVSPPAQSWSAQPESDSMILIVTIPQAGGSVPLPPARGGAETVRTIYSLDSSASASSGGSSAGKIEIQSVGEKQQKVVLDPRTAVEVNAELETTLTAVGGPARLLVLQAKPIAQKHYNHGPFVSYSMEEIQQCMNEYRRTNFGRWDGADDRVNPRDAPRFSRQNGVEEFPPNKEPL